MASRNNPLEVHMSTAGYNLQNFFYREIYLYAKQLKSGVLTDERFYQVMFEPTEKDLEDDNFWKNPEVWERTNPNMGVSPTYSYMEGKIAQAEMSEESLISFKPKHLHCWCDKADVWLKHKDWTANQKPIDEEALRGRKCYGGLDLAKSIDIAALVLLFPNDDGSFEIVTRFWIPSDRLRERVRRDKVPYHDWLKDDLIIATEGNIIDDRRIRKEINELREKFDLS